MQKKENHISTYPRPMSFPHSILNGMIALYDSIGACKRLMMTGVERIQSGFVKMWELGRMDLTFESVVVKEKYKNLFDEKTVTEAVERLKKFNPKSS